MCVIHFIPKQPMKRIFLIAVSALLYCQMSLAENESNGNLLTWEDFVERVIDDADDDSPIDEELFYKLQEMCAHPANINTITKEDLMLLPFVSEEKANDIMLYRERNGEMVSLGELMFIESLSSEDRSMLRLFVIAAPADSKQQSPAFSTLLKNAKQELTLRSDIPFYRRAAYGQYSESELDKSPNKVYRGDAYHHSAKYSISSMSHLYGGFQMEKDAGERGVDYLSCHIMLKDIGIIKRLAIGDYKLNFGKGLAVNSSMKLGKMMTLSSSDKIDAGISRHSSMAEANYFTGGAATIKLRGWEVTAFASYNKNDGTLWGDSSGVKTLVTDGLHRTRAEHDKKGNIAMTNVGGNIHWGNDNLKLSATAVATHFSIPLKPQHDTDASMYRLYNAEGSDYLVGSLSYSYRYRRLLFSGETAMSNTEKQNGAATLNSLRWKMNSSNSLLLLARYYGAKFVSINGKAFGENASVQNEEGVYAGWSTSSIRNVKLDLYADFMYFPWLKYQVSESSYGYEGVAQMQYSANSRWNITARYRIKSKQKDFVYDSKNGGKMLQYRTSHNLRVLINSQLSPALSLRTTANAAVLSFGTDSDDRGFSIGEDLRYQNSRNKLRIDMGLIYFNTDSYDSRVYGYEPSLMYSFGYSSYFYKGMRGMILANIPLYKDRLWLNTKFATTKYFNRYKIGTSQEMIDSSHKEDLMVQLRWSF